MPLKLHCSANYRGESEDWDNTRAKVVEFLGGREEGDVMFFCQRGEVRSTILTAAFLTKIGIGHVVALRATRLRPGCCQYSRRQGYYAPTTGRQPHEATAAHFERLAGIRLDSNDINDANEPARDILQFVMP